MSSTATHARPRKPSRLGWLVAGLNSSDRLRRSMAKHGTTLAGQKLWSTAELKALRHLYPDYRQACAVLPHRSFRAISSKAQRLGITRPLRIWSDDELKRLKGPFRKGAQMAELTKLLPGKTPRKIWRRACYSSWRRPRKPPAPTGLAPFDDVRMRAFACRMTMRDLADLSGTGVYFLRKPSRNNWQKIGKAVAMLEGNMAIMWKTP